MEVMSDRTKLKPQSAPDLVGDVHALAEQLGGAEGLSELRLAALSFPERCADYAALRQFFHDYCTQILIGWELPAIYRAYQHACRYEIRELIALDGRLSREPALQTFAAASQQVGSAQLRKLRPLRDQRIVQRYLDSLDHGQAGGCHLVVYGLILAIYSIPLRPGLISYGQQTLRGFIFSACLPFKLTDEERIQLYEEFCRRLADVIDGLLCRVTVSGC